MLVMPIGPVYDSDGRPQSVEYVLGGVNPRIKDSQDQAWKSVADWIHRGFNHPLMLESENMSSIRNGGEMSSEQLDIWRADHMRLIVGSLKHMPGLESLVLAHPSSIYAVKRYLGLTDTDLDPSELCLLQINVPASHGRIEKTPSAEGSETTFAGEGQSFDELWAATASLTPASRGRSQLSPRNGLRFEAAWNSWQSATGRPPITQVPQKGATQFQDSLSDAESA